MATQNKHFIFTFGVTAEFFTDADMYKIIDRVTGGLAATGETAAGVLQGLSNEGDAAADLPVGTWGEMKARTSEEITTRGAALTVDTGGFVKPAAVDDYVVGYFRFGTNGAYTAAAGDIITGMFDFITPVKMTA